MVPRLVVVLVCLALLGCTTTVDDTPTTLAPTTVPAPTTTVATTTPTTVTTLPPGTESLPEEMRADLSTLIALTSDIRDLEFLEPPTVVVVTATELAERVRDQLAEDLEDLPADEALYRLLGLIDDDVDLAQLYTDLYAEQVAGFYDGEVGELVVPAADDGFTPVQRATLVHELTHAVADQHFDFHSRYVEMLDEDRYDEASAYRALIEGDAVLAELRYLQQLGADEQAQFFAEALDVDTTLLDSAPRFVRDALIFPYEAGFAFVNHLYGAGGWDAIGEAYLEPPESTKQILDPEAFPAETPIDVGAADLEIDGYELAYRSTWGELGFRLMFDQVLGEEISATASSGWAGDTYHLFYDGADVVFVLHYRGDAAGDAERLGVALRQYVAAAMDVGDSVEHLDGTAFRDSHHAFVRVDDRDVYFVTATAGSAFDQAVEAIAPAPADPDDEEMDEESADL